jgi:hypothetical protein
MPAAATGSTTSTPSRTATSWSSTHSPNSTLVYERNPETGERVWQQRLNIIDTHDVDLINDDQLLVANMYNTKNGQSHDRIFIYDLGNDTVVWEWKFHNHYPNSTDGGMDDDWTHVNDVDKISDGEYLVSPRNFDQVIVVNRSTRNITMRLGADGDHDVLHEQHDPQYLESDDGTPTILVADSENNRVVEYSCTARTSAGDCNWEAVWTVGSDQLNWPRDADRLPNGNTLIVDSLGNRVIEVTPTGEIVWEAYVPWAPFDAERPAYGNEPAGPTMLEQNVTGSYALSGSAGKTVEADPGRQTFDGWLRSSFEETILAGPMVALADAWESGSQWVKPIWMAPWAFVAVVAALLLAVPWLSIELVLRYR